MLNTKDLTEDQLEKLQKIADREGRTPEELLEESRSFMVSAMYTSDKIAEVYKVIILQAIALIALGVSFLIHLLR